MARIDPTRAQIVLRLVYDGPAMAGKTTSLRALAGSLGVGIFSGEEEDGRTLYFDWLDYVGGLFEGMPIRCQIVGVPGQAVLESRRRQLLREADAVVFVVDSRPERMAENRRSYELLREIAAAAAMPIGIVVQANKRDYPSASSLDDIRDGLGEYASLAMTESIASSGEGVRETFVLGVRFALDRVRALWAERPLETLPPEFESGSQLLAAMMEREGGMQPADAPARETAAIDVTSAVHDSSLPRLPDASIPSGLVWPPVQGRAIVHEAARDAIDLARDGAGSWSGVSPSGRWHVSSPEEASFDDLEKGRTALISWARWHVATGRLLSADRAVVLAPGAAGKWRLWQIVRASRTLRDMCHDAVHLRGAAAGEKLFEILDLRRQAHRALVAPAFVERIALHTVALSANGDAVYAGGAAYPPRVNNGPRPVDPPEEDDALIEHEIIPALRTELSAAPERLSELLAGIEAAGIRRGRVDAAQSLRRNLLNA